MNLQDEGNSEGQPLSHPVSIDGAFVRTTEKHPELSIIVPAHNEQDNLPLLVEQLRTAMLENNIEAEIVIVDDGSTDGTAAVGSDLANKYRSTVRCFRHRTRSGKSSALQTGFDKSTAPIIALIDADLQYSPEELPRMFEKLKEGYDIVNGTRDFSRYPWRKRIVSKIYNKMAHQFIGYTGHDLNCGIKIIRRDVVESMRLRPGYHRYIVALAERNGFRVGEVNVQLSDRSAGKSSYSTSRILEGVVDLIALRVRFSFEERPMLLFGLSGAVLITLGLVIGGYLLFAAALGEALTLRPLTLLAVFAIIAGIQFLSFGVLSEMLLGIRDRIDSGKVSNARNLILSDDIENRAPNEL